MKVLTSKLTVVFLIIGIVALCSSCSQKTGCPAKNFKVELFN